jgi:hypothetical protein
MSDDFKRQHTGYRGPSKRTGRQYGKHAQCPCCTTGGTKAEQNRLARTRLAVAALTAALDGEREYREEEEDD